MSFEAPWLLAGLLLVPLVLAGGFLATTWRSTDRLDRVQAAIVNLDEPVKIDKQTVPLGRQLAGGLVNGGTEDDKSTTNFSWVLTDADGGYHFRTIKPGAYPWRNYVNSWWPAHIHVSVFGSGFVQRLITQMYFEGDPLIRHDPMIQGVPDKDAIERLIAPLDMNAAIPLDSLAYKFDIVLRGSRSTLFENRLEGN